MGLEILHKETQHVHEWLKDISTVTGLEDKKQALSCLRAVLHEVRDNLRIEELAHFSAQLPIIIRGFLFEGWQPTKTPVRERHKGDFLASLERILTETGHGEIEPESAARGVFQAIESHLSAGEVDKLKSIVPRGIWEVWRA